MNRGGIESYMMNYYRHFDHKIIQIDFVVHNAGGYGYYDEEIKNLGGQIFTLPQKSKHPLSYTTLLKTILKKGNYKIIHTHMDMYVADRRVLFYFIEGDRYTLKSRKVSSLFSGDLEKEPSVDRTLSLIDAFLATVPEEHSQHTELDYAVDYTAYLMQEEPGVDAEDESEVPKLRGHELIDDFIQKSESSDASDTRREFLVEKEEETEEEEEPSVSPVTEELDDSCFTETLAKIYIKQHRYDKALEIIKKLSLNYPKKNAYFADQIRFLEKLIINAKSK